MSSSPAVNGDQGSQSHNIFLQGVSGKKLDAIYTKAWQCGLKTTYYLRTLGATQIEKATLDAKTFGFTQKRSYTVSQEQNASEDKEVRPACNLEEGCESCQ